MKKSNFPLVKLILLVLLSAPTFAQLQSTWTKTIFYDGGGWSYTANHYDSLHVGPSGIAMRPDGKFFVLNCDYMQGHYTVYLMDSLGNIINTNWAGHWGGVQEWDSYSIKSTKDSGCVFIEHYFDFTAGSPLPVSFSIKKIDKDGVLSNLHTWNYPDTLFSIIPTNHNSYYCNVNHLTIDFPLGDTIPDSLIGLKLFENDDFLFIDSTLHRNDRLGNLIWTLPISGESYLGATENVIYLKGDSLTKINAITGEVIWKKGHPISFSPIVLCNQKTEGLIDFWWNQISIIDSSGNFVGQNALGLLSIPSNVISSSPDGSIYVGGIFYTQTTNYSNYGPYRSSIIIKLNEEGHGVIDSTDEWYSADADIDSTITFFDDAVIMAAAQGATNGHPDINFPVMHSNSYVVDWADKFESGLNYKYSDADGNGRIDTNDISLIANFYDQHNGIFNKHVYTSGAPIAFISRSSIYAPQDSIIIDVIVGSSLEPVDSIYGISATFNACQYPGLTYPLQFEIHYGVLEDTNSLFSQLHIAPFGQNIVDGIVLCRQDHHNKFLAGDTLLTIRSTIDPSVQNGSMTICSSFHAITKGGFDVPLYPISSTVTILNNEITDPVRSNLITISPIPAITTLKISAHEKPIENLVLRNVLGENVYQVQNPPAEYEFSVADLSPGIYYLESTIEGKRYLNKVCLIK
jgi:hypothetical protein